MVATERDPVEQGRKPGLGRAETWVEDEETAAPPRQGVEPGYRVGRYLVLHRIGAGGMGVVVAAYDPELDRKIALKLLRLGDWSGGSRGTEGRNQLLAEAQALARLSHPHVVTVHDVGTEAEQLFIAMELVDGVTLSRWVLQERRPWRTCVQTLLGAGRGLAAAHREGIVHRDFKPDNVLVDASDHARVVDFGLALYSGAGTSGSDSGKMGAKHVSGSVKIQRASSGGRRAGTPAYMAAEQFRREAADDRTDQFAFCVTLWEALFGARPFPGETRTALEMAVLAGEIKPPPKRTGVPRAVERALRRGLSVAPAERWSSMEALLDALDRAGTRRQRRTVAGAAVAVVLGGGAWAVASERAADPCAGARERVTDVFDDATRLQIRDAFGATRLSYGTAVAEHVVGSLEDYADAWIAAHRDACEATHVRHEQSEDLLDRRMTCLDARLQVFRATVEALPEADANTVRSATQTVADLPALERCADKTLVTDGPPPPDDAQLEARVAQTRDALAQASARAATGKAREAAPAMEAALEAALDLDYPPLRAEAWLHQGQLLSRAGDAERAEHALQEAVYAALASRHDEVLAAATTGLVIVAGIERSKYDEGRLWARQAEAAVARLAEPGRASIRLQSFTCRLYADMGKPHQALPHCQQAVELARARSGEAHVDTLSARHTLGMAHYAAGSLDDAHREFTAAYEGSVKLLGDNHPSQVPTLGALAAVCYSRGDPGKCVPEFEAAYQAAVRAHGQKHPLCADFGNNLAYALIGANELDEAEAAAKHALAVRREVTGDDHPGVAASLRALGTIEAERGRFEAALSLLDDAHARFVETRGADHPDVEQTLRARRDVQAKASAAAAAAATPETPDAAPE